MRVIGENIRCDCKDCTERHIGCHGTCEKYQDYIKRNEEIKKKRKIESMIPESNGWVYKKKRGRK